MGLVLLSLVLGPVAVAQPLPEPAVELGPVAWQVVPLERPEVPEHSG